MSFRLRINDGEIEIIRDDQMCKSLVHTSKSIMMKHMVPKISMLIIINQSVLTRMKKEGQVEQMSQMKRAKELARPFNHSKYGFH